LAVPLLLDAVLSESQYSDWGWRVAFLPAVALGVLSFILRRRLAESALFSRIRDAGELSPSPLRELFTAQWRSWLAMTLQVGMVSAAETVVLHRMDAPDQFAALPGARLSPEFPQRPVMQRAPESAARAQEGCETWEGVRRDLQRPSPRPVTQRGVADVLDDVFAASGSFSEPGPDTTARPIRPRSAR
jgi:hypothetical protein